MRKIITTDLICKYSKSFTSKSTNPISLQYAVDSVATRITRVKIHEEIMGRLAVGRQSRPESQSWKHLVRVVILNYVANSTDRLRFKEKLQCLKRGRKTYVNLKSHHSEKPHTAASQPTCKY